MLRSYGKYPGNHPKETQTQVFFCKYYKIFKNTYFENQNENENENQKYILWGCIIEVNAITQARRKYSFKSILPKAVQKMGFKILSFSEKLGTY